METIGETEVNTAESFSKGSSESATTTYVGTPERINALASTASSLVPSGYTYDSHTVTTSEGVSTLVIKGIKYATGGGSVGSLRTSFGVDMTECTYDLEDHPHVSGVRDKCVKWISDGCIFHDNKYYTKEEDQETQIVNETAIQFCAAYSAGIKTFNRYFPVINKISYYSNPPGLTMSGGSFSGGSPTFSSNIGTFDNPPISLNGYPSNKWFKSKDSWEELPGRSWKRVEQWTYTPDSNHSWIYS